MALADLQTVWTNKMKPLIQQTYAKLTDLIKPVEIPDKASGYSFAVNDIVCIDGIIYRCAAATANPPFPLVTQDGALVYEEINGVKSYIASGTTLSAGWEKWLDIRDRYQLEQLRQTVNTKQAAISNMASLGTGYAACSTAGDTAAKTVTIGGFTLKPNGIVSVLFRNAFTATEPTLNVSGTGAKPIYQYGQAVAIGKVKDNTILTMAYDGTAYEVIAIESLAGHPSGIFVDLGLPSGLLWADRNVGAARPSDSGEYFSWGNSVGHAADDGYDFGGSVDGPYGETSGATLTADIAVGTNDAARANMGAPWRLPTVAEFEELIANSSVEITSEDGIVGARFTSAINGNSVFLPAVGLGVYTKISSEGFGYYTTSVLADNFSSSTMMFSSSHSPRIFNLQRFYGTPVRAVM